MQAIELKKGMVFDDGGKLMLVFALVFVGLLLIPGMPSYLAPESRVCLLIWCVLGIIFYLKTNRKKELA